ncbi:PLP-dependent aminotransferase family protein [Paenibacillus sp. GCM10027627]|uniref:MocR-like pyridoxine biosynthesis transcription factor PdxR n=1 Tax=unclassified Paenibacillus TaxID=185978 RepID=UPI0036411900
MPILSFTPLLNKQGQTPIYIQIYQYIRSGIENGTMAAGGRLPSIRQLAQHLSISKNTVESAYGQLLAEGYVESKERGGYAILPIEKWTPITPKSPGEAPAQGQNRRTATTACNPPQQQIKIEFDFQYGEIALDRFPHAIWKSCVIEALGSDPARILGYGDPYGMFELRKELAEYVYQSRGVVCEPDQIFIAAGTQHAVAMLVQLLQLGKRPIAMEEPGYNGVKSVLRNMGCDLLPVSVEPDGISFEQLSETAARLVYVTPSHQFPLGMVMPIQKRLRLLGWAMEQNGYILEDDYDSEFRYNSAPIPALKALDTAERVIYLGTLSKSFLPAARLSYVILPSGLMSEVKEGLEVYSQAVSPMIQYAIWLFMKKGHFARHVRRMRRVYQTRHKALTDAIRACFGSNASIVGDCSGMHLLLAINGKRADELIALAAQHGCKVYSPAKHWNNGIESSGRYVMLGFGGMTEGQLEEGIKRLQIAWLQ